MKKLYGIIVLLGCLIITSVNAQERVFEHSTNEVKVQFHGNISNNKLSASLDIEKISENKTIILSSLIIDLQEENYKLKINEKLILKAKEINESNVIDNNDLDKIIEANNHILDKYSELLNIEEMKSEETQGFFYFQSIFQIIKRYRNVHGSANYECTTYNGYIVGISPYYAKEDIIINVNDFKHYIQNIQVKVKKETADFIVEALSTLNDLEVDFKTLENLLDNTFSDRKKAFILSGSDCGCCGNYEGQCWFASANCLVHDLICQSCKPRWFCFSGCKPTKC
jgi:hypothetical protein